MKVRWKLRAEYEQLRRYEVIFRRIAMFDMADRMRQMADAVESSDRHVLRCQCSNPLHAVAS